MALQTASDSFGQLGDSCNRCLHPGRQAQDFTAVAVKEDGGKIATSLFTFTSLHSDYVVLLYLPKLGLLERAELVILNKLAPRFKEVNCTILAVTGEGFPAITKFMERDASESGLGGLLDFLILADKGSHVATLYGLQKRGADGGTIKATFLLDKQRVVRYRSCTADNVMQSMEELLRRLVGVQQLEQQGHQFIAPAGWIRGSQLIPATPQAKKDYYKQQTKAEKYHSNSVADNNNKEKGSSDIKKEKARQMGDPTASSVRPLIISPSMGKDKSEVDKKSAAPGGQNKTGPLIPTKAQGKQAPKPQQKQNKTK